MRLFTLIAILLSFLNASAQEITILDVRPGSVKIEAFQLNQRNQLELFGEGGSYSEGSRLLVHYAWILDASSREVVWHQLDENGRRDYRDWRPNERFNYEIELDKGTYELHFATGVVNRWSNNRGDFTIASLEEAIETLFYGRDDERNSRDRYNDDYFVTLKGNFKLLSKEEARAELTRDAIISMTGFRDYDTRKAGFNLTDKASLIVYSIGEGDNQDIYDYLIITEVTTGDEVYRMNYRNFKEAGGAYKNIMVLEEITLDKGSYEVIYSTDDSHSNEYWNALPPDDPDFYGVTIYASSDSDLNTITDFNPPVTSLPALDLTKVKNDETVSGGFTLAKDMKIEVLCIGEGQNDRLYDYGWIVDAESQEIIWKMKEYRADPAGGARKNRRVKETLNLKKGSYIAYFITDDSHAYNSWNDRRPDNAELWGLSLWLTDESDMDYFQTFHPEENESSKLIGSILRPTDDGYYRESFTLDAETRVRIVAIGEGSNGEMYDYAWIKNMDTGKNIWKMKYNETEHAGGSSKNRMVSDIITLPRGEYRLYYETDGSHSYGDWNASPPLQEDSYGVKVLLVK